MILLLVFILLVFFVIAISIIIICRSQLKCRICKWQHIWGNIIPNHFWDIDSTFLLVCTSYPLLKAAIATLGSWNHLNCCHCIRDRCIGIMEQAPAFTTFWSMVKNVWQQHLEALNYPCLLLVVVLLVTVFSMAQQLSIQLVEFVMLHKVRIFDGWLPIVFPLPRFEKRTNSASWRTYRTTLCLIESWHWGEKN